jgi:hypothetical protein
VVLHHQFTILFCKSTTGGFLLKTPFKSIVILHEIQNFYINPLIIKWQYMFPDAPYFIILLCLTPDGFTHQGWVLPLNGLKLWNILAVYKLFYKQQSIYHRRWTKSALKSLQIRLNKSHDRRDNISCLILFKKNPYFHGSFDK